MVPVHIWAGPNCIGIHDLPRRLRLLDLPASLRLNPFYNQQTFDLERFENPLIHIFQVRANNRQWTRIHRAILENEPSVHVIILTQDDVRADTHGNNTWLINPIKQACANARNCSNTRVIMVDLIRPKGEQNLSVRRKLKRTISDNSDVVTRVDAAKHMSSSELNQFGLTAHGERFLIEIVVQALQEIPVHAFD